MAGSTPDADGNRERFSGLFRQLPEITDIPGAPGSLTVSHRRIKLTEAGKQILPYAGVIIENEKQMERTLGNFLNREKNLC